MKKTIAAVLALVLASGLAFGIDTSAFKQFYTIHVATFFAKDCIKAHGLYEKLKNEGLMVYYIRDKENNHDCVRIRVGVFGNEDEAKQAARAFKEAHKMDAVAAKTLGISISDFNGKFDIINTPSGLWLYDYKNFRELKNFGTDFYSETVAAENPASVSPDGREVVYFFNGKINKIDIASGKELVLLDKVKYGSELERSSPKWSNDGKYVAFLDKFDAKNKTCLKLLKADGSQVLCLVDNSHKNRAVMSFVWAPKGGRIYYVEGEMGMRVPVGGGLFYTDLKGHETALVTPEKGSVVYKKFEVEGNKVLYAIAKFKNKAKDEYDLSPEQSLEVK